VTLKVSEKQAVRFNLFKCH